MLFDEYMKHRSEGAEDRIRAQFSRGRVSRSGLIDTVRDPLRNADGFRQAAEWFEEAHGDDVSQSLYCLRDPEDDHFPDAPDVMVCHRFINTLRHYDDDQPDELSSTIRHPEGTDEVWVVFNDDEGYPRPFDG